MHSVHHLGLADYFMIVLSLVASLGIGIHFHFSGRKQGTSKDYLLAGKNMSRLPVVLSIVVTYLSAITMIGAPAEIYRYGSQLMVLILGMTIGMIVASYLFLPIYFNLGTFTVYEYLEMRYGKFTRTVVSGLFILQMMLYMSVALYAPALSLSAVTDLTTETSVLLMGFVCIVYCTVGGLKAVLWTDAFQCVLIYACLISAFIVGVIEVGGIGEVIRRAQEGERWKFFNLNVDLTTRYTVWNALLRGMSLGIGGYGVSQLEVQRLLSINVVKCAQSALLWSILPMMILVFMCHFLGLILYGVFNHCDPILNREQTGLTKHDQLLPYYIVTRLNQIPGLTGLCIAGLFSGSLGTLSSVVNSISTVTVVDFIQPHCSFLKDKQIVWIAKGLIIQYGSLCIGFAFLLGRIGNITQMATVALSILEGPVIAIFLLGILTERTNEMGSAVGLLAGCILSGWIGYGSMLSGYIYPTLPISAENCSGVSNVTGEHFESVMAFKESAAGETNSTSRDVRSQSNILYLYRISFMWIPTTGFVCSACLSYLASILTHRNKKKIDANFLSPFVRKWMSNPAFEEADEVNLEGRNVINSPQATVQSIKRSAISHCML